MGMWEGMTKAEVDALVAFHRKWRLVSSAVDHGEPQPAEYEPVDELCDDQEGLAELQEEDECAG